MASRTVRPVLLIPTLISLQLVERSIAEVSYCHGSCHSSILKPRANTTEMRDEVLTSVLSRMQVFWNVMMYCWVNSTEVSKDSSAVIFIIRQYKKEGSVIC
jgi:hypothetical protein